MEVSLIGSTTFLLSSIPVATGQEIDLLSEDEHRILSISNLEIGGVEMSVGHRLRTAITPLRFFHYTFLSNSYYDVDPYLEAIGSNILEIDGRILIQASLFSWIIGCHIGTKSKNLLVVEYFDRIYLLLKNVARLHNVMSRFNVQQIIGTELFRLEL
jgi:hypothetical protein